MEHRSLFSAALVVAGAVCLTAAALGAAWVDTAYLQEHTALNQASVQLGPQRVGQWYTRVSVMAPVIIWVAFGVGLGLVTLGALFGLLSRGQPPGPGRTP
jgi:hypothetical protein